MALNATTLAALMKSNIQAQANNGLGTGTDADHALTALCNAFASAIVTHFQSAAVVNVASVSGVTTGVGVSGPGVGTIS